MAENKSIFSDVVETCASMAAAEMESCFTCFLKTDDFIRIIEADGENRAAIFGQHFWFTRDEYYNRTVCTSCWARIDEFHQFYSEIKSAHLLQLGQNKIEVKVELLEEVDETQPQLTLESPDSDSEEKVFAEPLDDPFDSDGSETEWKPPKKAKKEKEKRTRPRKKEVNPKSEKQLKMDQKPLDNGSETLNDHQNDSDCSDKEREPETEKPIKDTKEPKPRARVHKKPTFDCQLCREDPKGQIEEKYSTYYSLKKHSLEVHGKSPVMYCSECDQQYHSECAFHRHSAKHRGIPVRTGKRKHPSSEEVASPIDNADPNPAEKQPLKPNEGDEFYYYKKRLPPEVVAEQDAVITKVVTLACAQCTYIADTFANFRRHGTQEHGLTNAVVHCCQGRFHTRTSLYDHCVTHIDPDRFRCELCGKKFRCNQRLKLHHWSIHTPASELPYKCTHCSKAFMREYMLAKHMTYHRNQEQKTFSCVECDLVFTQKYTLKYHRIKVHGEPTPWLCDICAEPFAQPGRLKKHRITHSEEEMAKQMVQCEKCGKWLPNKCKRNTARHIKACTGGGGRSLAPALLPPPPDDGMAMWFGSSGLS